MSGNPYEFIGRNELKTRHLFSSRLTYLARAYPRYGPTPIDLLYSKPYYGKVDIYGNPIYPSEKFLKPIPGKNQLALNFVADAFKDLRKHLLRGNNANKTLITKAFSNFKVKKSWVNVHQAYHDYFSKVVFEPFAQNFLNTERGRGNKVKTFDDYVKQFMFFCKTIKTVGPITKTSFITSTYCPSSISGMILDLSNLRHDSDFEKYTVFIRDPFFDSYRRAVSNFGFFIDKNAPWRLAVNLSSKKTKEYMARYGLASEDNSVFDDYFYRSRKFDYKSLKVYLFQGYKSYIATKPFALDYEVHVSQQTYKFDMSPSLPTTKTIRHTTPRNFPYNLAQFSELYDDKYFLDVYFKVRLMESKKQMTTSRYRVELRRTYSFLKNLGIDAAVNHIDYLTKQTRIYEAPIPGQPPRITFFGKKTQSGLQTLSSGDILSKVGEKSLAYGTIASY
jgi:hypothetical protein